MSAEPEWSTDAAIEGSYQRAKNFYRLIKLTLALSVIGCLIGAMGQWPIVIEMGAPLFPITMALWCFFAQTEMGWVIDHS